MPVKPWKPINPEVIGLIISKLIYGRKDYTSLWNAIKEELGSKTTLSLYLRSLEKLGVIKSEAERVNGRWRVYYSIKGVKPFPKIQTSTWEAKDFINYLKEAAWMFYLGYTKQYLRYDLKPDERKALLDYLRSFCRTALADHYKELAQRIKEKTYDRKTVLEAIRQLENELTKKSDNLKNVSSMIKLVTDLWETRISQAHSVELSAR
jgi:hypothetical protein